MRAPDVMFLECNIHTNTGDGLSAQSAAFSRWTNGKVLGCSIHDNGDAGIRTSGAEIIISNCLIYDNTDGIIIPSTAVTKSFCGITNCTFFNNSADGIDGSATAAGTISSGIYNNTFRSNGGSAFTLGNLDTFNIDYNHANNNTTSDTLPGDNNATGDPLFTSEVDGSEDFIPLTGSPLIGAGVNGGNIGAVAHADGGGGGLLVHPGMTGGMRG
jgi:hypothetical protein